jgi:hypothetical protein
MNQRLLDHIDAQRPMRETIQNVDEMSWEDDLLTQAVLDMANAEEGGIEQGSLHKRKPSMPFADATLHPSLRTQLTDDLESML